jgi:hypothetical protein
MRKLLFVGGAVLLATAATTSQGACIETASGQLIQCPSGAWENSMHQVYCRDPQGPNVPMSGEFYFPGATLVTGGTGPGCDRAAGGRDPTGGASGGPRGGEPPRKPGQTPPIFVKKKDPAKKE